MESLYAPPPVFLILSISTFTLALAFTSSRSPLRFLGLIPMLSYVPLVIGSLQMQDDSLKPIYMSVFFGGTASMLMQYLDSALLSRWSYEAQGPTSAAGGQKSLRSPSDAFLRKQQSTRDALYSRLAFGWEEAFRARYVRTPWEVNHVPKFFPERPDLLPTKTQFLYRFAQELLFSILFLDVIGLLGRDKSKSAIILSADRISLITRLHDVTDEEIVVRIFASLMHWLAIVCLLQVMYDCVAIVVISLDLGRIERWPPVFNYWGECWSIRQFWGSFWHQTTRRKFSAPANFLCFLVLRVSKGTLVARYTLLTLTFLISGVFHRVGDMASGLKWKESGALRFFAMQAVGIMVEDIVQGTFRLIWHQDRTSAPPRGWKRALGSIWLALWLFWTTPCWNYPLVQITSGQSVLPFSLLERFF
ncbi:hypothetical protein ACLMJK_003663 [Lecanora helva]